MNPREERWSRLHDQFLTEWFEQKHAEALATASDEVAAAQDAFGVEHPSVVQALFDLAMAQEKCQHSQTSSETLAAAQRMLAALEDQAALQPEAPATAALLIFLADRMWTLVGDHETEVLSRYRQALRIREKLFGTEHAETADVLARLAEIDFLRGNFAAAEPQYRRAITMYENSAATDRPYAMKSCQGLADTLIAMNRLQEALPFFQQALSLCEAKAVDRRSLYFVLMNYAGCQAQAGRSAQAESLRARAEALLPKNNPGAFGYQTGPA